MTTFELLSINKNLLSLMSSASVDVNDVKYIEMYVEYKRLTGEGHKKTYIMQYLSEEYGVSERHIFRIVDKFSSEIEI